MSSEYKPLSKPNVSHYQQGGIEPIDFITSNSMNFLEGNVVKYVHRYRKKNGLDDLLKAKQYLEWLIEIHDGAVVDVDKTEEERKFAELEKVGCTKQKPSVEIQPNAAPRTASELQADMLRKMRGETVTGENNG